MEYGIRNISHSWSNNRKGYSYEIPVCREQIIKIPHIEYESNPVDYSQWLKEHNKNDYDGIITLPNGDKIHLEMKFRHCKKVYHSWFMNCWIARKFNVVVTNNKNVISYQDRRLLESQHKKLMSLSELIIYVGRLVRNILYPSKYLYLIISNSSKYITFLYRLILKVYNKLTKWRDKFKKIIFSFQYSLSDSRSLSRPFSYSPSYCRSLSWIFNLARYPNTSLVTL